METYVSEYTMEEILMQGGRPICYHFELFDGEFLNYHSYNMEFYALVHVVKKWKHYLMGKEIVMHISHHHYNIARVIYNKTRITSG